MNVSEQKQGAVAVLKPDSAVADPDVSTFKSAVAAAIETNLGRCVVDLSTVPFVDSLGLEALLDLSDQVAQGGRAMKLCAVNKTVRQILELTGLVEQFDYYEDVNSAVRSFL